MAGFFADWGKYSEYFLIPCVKIFDSQIALEFQSILKAIFRSESVINIPHTTNALAYGGSTLVEV